MSIEIIPNWHPFFVHFTIALFTVSALFFVLSRVAANGRSGQEWLNAAYWTLWLGVILTIGTVIAGVFAFNSVTHDTPSHKVMLEHRTLALATLGLYVVLGAWAVFAYKSKGNPGIVFVAAVVLSCGLLYTTAYHGAELVYRHGMGVKRLPNPDDHSHADGGGHDHGTPSSGGQNQHTEDGHGGHDHGAPATATSEPHAEAPQGHDEHEHAPAAPAKPDQHQHDDGGHDHGAASPAAQDKTVAKTHDSLDESPPAASASSSVMVPESETGHAGEASEHEHGSHEHGSHEHGH